MGPARIVLAGDHDLVRSGMLRTLADEPDLEVVGEAQNGREALGLCRRLRPDLVLMDVRMPEMDGLQATRAIKAELPSVAVLVVTTYENPNHLFEALKAGAAGYVLKSVADRDLVEAVRAAMRGEPFLYAGAERALVRDYVQRARAGEELSEDPLTPREQQIVKLIAESNTNRQIAELLTISEKTVETHRANILEKLGMRDRVELTRYAIRRGFVEP